MKRDFAEPEAQGLPVDQENHFKGDQRKLYGEPKQAGGGEGLAFAGQGAEEDLGTRGAIAVVDVDVKMVGGDFEFEKQKQSTR